MISESPEYAMSIVHTQAPTVSIVIPNWNGLAHLPDCLESLKAQSMRPTETIIVDNGSTDGSVDFVRNNYPWASIVMLPSNAGVAVAMNRGIVASNGEYVALLNNDTALAPDWLETMVRALQSESAVGSVACKMLRFFDRQTIDAAGDFLTRAGSPYSRGSNEPDDGRYDTREFIFGACGAAALFRRIVFDDIGLFDEDFVSHYEDVDLAFRAQLAGYRCLYVPDAVCYHKRGATYNSVSDRTIRIQERNLTAYYVKSFPAGLLLAKLPLILASRARRLYRSFRTGVGSPAVAGLWEGVMLAPKMIGKRKSVQPKRRTSINYMKSFMRRHP
jgi:GT2 family glycosyltransferase